jgi:hypothetical protein
VLGETLLPTHGGARVMLLLSRVLVNFSHDRLIDGVFHCFRGGADEGT